MLERLRHGDAGGALDILFRYPEHPGFKILGVGAAALHQALSPGRPISDMRLPSGEWLPAFAFSLGSVASIALTYALGRPVDYRDMPVVRDIVRKAALDNNRFASLVSQIVASDAFRRRDAAKPAATVAAAGDP